MESINKKTDLIKSYLSFLYNNEVAKKLTTGIGELIERYRITETNNELWSEKDAILITYGDSILGEDSPLQELNAFASKYLKDKISCIHLLPFFPYSSDDGFSVIDYKEVNPEVGNWEDIEVFRKNFSLMFDLVINHISQHSEWFKKYLENDNKYKDYFIEESQKTDLSQVTRPRSTPLLTTFKQTSEEKHVWTTFSDDQIDLNFSNPEVLLDMMEILLMYAHKGARIIRLDAIAFLWKRVGTTCLHLTETHTVVKLMRTILECVNPHAIILTETNVPNLENLSYFGKNDEAHMVYQFSLPPLLLHTMFSGDSQHLTSWAKDLPELSKGNTYFNFTASHDGIGVRPLEGLLPVEKLGALVKGMLKNGGHVSFKSNSDGSKSPYEINISLFDAYSKTQNGDTENHISRFLCSQTIMMTMKGIPALYIHSILATPNYHEGVKKTGRHRTINRKQLDSKSIETLINDPKTDTSTVYFALMGILELRQQYRAFHPNSYQEILKLDDDLFALKRSCDTQTIISISNITNKEKKLSLQNYNIDQQYSLNIFNNNTFLIDDTITMKPYETVWLLKSNEEAMKNKKPFCCG